MWKTLFPPAETGGSKKKRPPSSWDVVVLSFSLLYQQIQFWIRPNFWMILLSLPVLTAPGAQAGLYRTVAAGLRDPALVKVKPREEMKAGFFKYLWKALGLAAIKWAALLVILISMWFWVSQEGLIRFTSIISIYGLALWWLASGYLYPALIEHPEARLMEVVKEAAALAFRKPFESLLFAVVSTLLNLLGTVLLGPILLVIPALTSILHTQGYWYLTGKIVPGFMDLVEYTNQYYDRGHDEL